MLLVESREQPRLEISMADPEWSGTYSFNFVAQTYERSTGMLMIFNLPTAEAEGEMLEVGAISEHRGARTVEGTGVKVLVASWKCR